jgi:hypothetical protein
MPWETVFSVGGHTMHLSGFYVLLLEMLLLGIAGFLLGLSRGRRVVLQRSGLTDELALHLGRIADTLERIANQIADRSITEAREVESGTAVEPAVESAPRPENHPIPYSMFGR